jgi:hypothetical protein
MHPDSVLNSVGVILKDSITGGVESSTAFTTPVESKNPTIKIAPKINFVFFIFFVYFINLLKDYLTPKHIIPPCKLFSNFWINSGYFSKKSAIFYFLSSSAQPFARHKFLIVACC